MTATTLRRGPQPLFCPCFPGSRAAVQNSGNVLIVRLDSAGDALPQAVLPTSHGVVRGCMEVRLSAHRARAHRARVHRVRAYRARERAGRSSARPEPPKAVKPRPVQFCGS